MVQEQFLGSSASESLFMKGLEEPPRLRIARAEEHSDQEMRWASRWIADAWCPGDEFLGIFPASPTTGEKHKQFP